MARLPFPQRAVLVVLLTAFLTAPAVLIAQPRPRGEERQTGFFALMTEIRFQVWSLLADPLEKEGCGIDPHGCPKAVSSERTRVVSPTLAAPLASRKP
jgi:hypothetical protein